eukprot:CAMPEP_0180328760 /NCGR_PEP_ID=MMETSP0988-20121125/40391_1 /TAXON_ID=697907 /ORGANISM="non described non described, Strain CCMP2293" /LENGTH=121 /DNA_ID=CAMNT_0022315801 /DNA_START=239 /DNA_END=605 /DNA_ORIENTATION=-
MPLLSPGLDQDFPLERQFGELGGQRAVCVHLDEEAKDAAGMLVRGGDGGVVPLDPLQLQRDVPGPAEHLLARRGLLMREGAGVCVVEREDDGVDRDLAPIHQRPRGALLEWRELGGAQEAP